jgi:uncharacterized oxidoreductase
MNLTNKTILITGGGSGIGLDTAKLLIEKNNRVIIIGRNLDKLEKASAGLKNITAYGIDITNIADIEKLVTTIKTSHPDLSVLINNAASAYAYNHADDSNSFEKASEEIQTNYLSVIRLTEKLLPVLKSQPESAIVNVTSIVAFSPNANIPTYSDSKAALRSYTLGLRYTLSKDTKVKVFELMPPLVNTHLSEAIGGLERGMPSVEVARALIEGMENEVYEITVGDTKGFRDLFYSNPAQALLALNA